MNEQNPVPLSKSDAQCETSPEKKKTKHFPSRACGCGKVPSPVRSDSKSSSGHVTPEDYQENCENSSERQGLKMKLFETRNAAEETSQGVQQFIRHVSSFIEKKNPFKDKILYPSTGSGKDAAPDDSIEFHLTRKLSSESLKSRPLSVERLSDTALAEAKEHTEKQKVPEKLSVLHSGKLADWNFRSKTLRGIRKGDYSARKFQKEASPDIKRIFQLSSVKKQDRRSPIESGRINANSPGRSAHYEGPPGLSPIKKKKPSEIPLRKSRVSARGARKQISKLHLNFYDVYATDKTFLPLEELNLSSEFELALNMNCNSEKAGYNDERKVFLATQERSSESEFKKGKKLANYSKRSRVAAVYSSELLEDNSEEASSYRIIDLSKMQTTSFTILKTDNVFDKLENIKKRSVLESKKPSLYKSCSVTSKTKTSLKTVKGKTSKRNLCRTSSKGNKPGLKAKTKKSKKEVNLFKKENLANNEKTIHQCLVTGKAWWERRKTANFAKQQTQKEAGAFHVPVKLVRTKAKSFLRGIDAPKKKECSKMFSGKFHELYDDVRTETLKPGTPITRRPSEEFPKNKESDHEVESECGEKTLVSCPSKAEEIGTQTNPREIEESMKLSRTTVSDEKLNLCDAFSTDNDSEIRNEEPEEIAKENESDKESRCSLEVAEIRTSDCSKGTLGKDEPPEGEDLPKVKKRIRIDLNPTENILKCKTIENNPERAEPFDWLFLNEKNYDDEPPSDIAQTNNSESERITEGSIKSGQDTVADSLSSEAPEDSTTISVSVQKSRRSCSSLKRKRGEEKRLYKCSEGAAKVSRKKKIRSDSGGRRFPSSKGFFNSDIALLNKVIPDIRQRSGLTKSYIRDEKKDLFEDLAVVKLKRRNSEPHSLRGYVWKCSATTRGHKPSVSSLASSLRHLNTDDIDDFTFWEAIPQRKTPWETSLYHFKRPWSVLSCAIFKDNRRSSTPGLILENLRNGGFRRFSPSESERLKCRKENPFDVEPSIAQKNIDVRNWLAALNFPTIPSTSNDFLQENGWSGQSSHEPQRSNKIQTTPRRRKMVSNLKFSGEAAEKICEETEKAKNPTKWNGSDAESLTELTQRLSGGFLSNEQYINSENSIWPNATLTVCVYSNSFEKSFLMEASDTNFGGDLKEMELETKPQDSKSEISVVDARGDQPAEKLEAKEEPVEVEIKEKSTLSSSPNPQTNNSEVNIWKYLFLFTIFIIGVNYIFSSG